MAAAPESLGSEPALLPAPSVGGLGAQPKHRQGAQSPSVPAARAERVCVRARPQVFLVQSQAGQELSGSYLCCWGREEVFSLGVWLHVIPAKQLQLFPVCAIKSLSTETLFVLGNVPAAANGCT